jgi:cytochrome c553
VYGLSENGIIMREISARNIRAWVTLALLAAVGAAHASNASVDRATQRALALDAHPDNGQTLFAQNCKQCHGERGHGDADRAVPALAGQRFTYLVRQLANFSGSERDSRAMHRVVSRIEPAGPQAWVDLASYLAKIPSAKGLTPGDGTHVALGRGIFHEQCAGCHLADARGDLDGFVPSLRNQHYAYLLGQLQKMSEGARHNMDADLVRFMRGFDGDEMRATADYLSRLRGAGSAHTVMRSNGVVVD